MRTMYDGIDSDADVIPTGAQLVAGYVDGDYVWSPADWARFPDSVHVGIAVRSSTDDGQVLDVENGDATPPQSVDWVLLRRAAGTDPTVYCSTSTWPTVRAAFQARAVTEPRYWLAQYDGIAAVPPGAIAKQYASTVRWDLSAVADYWPGVDPAPKPQPPAPPAAIEEDDEMQQIEPIKDHPGEYAYGAIGKSRVVFCADGYAQPPASLRVVFWVGDSPQVHDGVLVGGAGTKAASLNFPAGTNAVTVHREDSSGFPISVQMP